MLGVYNTYTQASHTTNSIVIETFKSIKTSIMK